MANKVPTKLIHNLVSIAHQLNLTFKKLVNFLLIKILEILKKDRRLGKKRGYVSEIAF